MRNCLVCLGVLCLSLIIVSLEAIISFSVPCIYTRGKLCFKDHYFPSVNKMVVPHAVCSLLSLPGLRWMQNYQYRSPRPADSTGNGSLSISWQLWDVVSKARLPKHRNVGPDEKAEGNYIHTGTPTLISTDVLMCSTHENPYFLEVAGPNCDHYQRNGLYRKAQTIPETWTAHHY